VAVEREYGFKASFNPTFLAASGNPHGWVSPWHFGLNEGPRFAASGFWGRLGLVIRIEKY
jgi:hypothetical protein